VLFPTSDAMDGEGHLMSMVADAVAAVTARPELGIVLGAAPHGPSAASGWIEPGPPVEGLEQYAVRAVRRFLPRQSPAQMIAPGESDALVNTRVVIVKVRTLITLGNRYLPDVLEALEPLQAAFDTPEEALLCEALYEQMPHASIAHALFARPGDVAVLAMTQARKWHDLPALAS
jgi:mannose-1-phosphate guanylyltransferase